MSRQNDMKARYAELKLNEDQINEVEEAFLKADKAQKEFETWSQEAIDRAIQSVAQIVSNSKTFHELVELGIQESNFGDPISREAKRFKIRGILRDCLRQKSVGIVDKTEGDLVQILFVVRYFFHLVPCIKIIPEVGDAPAQIEPGHNDQREPQQ